MPGGLHHDIAKLYYGYYGPHLHYRVHSMGDDELDNGNMLTTSTQQHNILHIRLSATHLPMVVSDFRLVESRISSFRLLKVMRMFTLNRHGGSCPHICVVTMS